MAKLTKNTLFKPIAPRAETAMDKTSRAVKEIQDAATEQRTLQMDRLRKARLERDAKPAIKKAKPRRKAVSQTETDDTASD
jgi:hypothetical protein